MILHPILTAFLLVMGAPDSFAREGDVIKLDVRSSMEEKEVDPSEELEQIQKRIRDGDLPKIQFDFASWRIREESYPTLDLIADLLLRNPQRKLLIFAHTCDIGSDKFNLNLSHQRAKSVKGYLVQRGVPPPSIRFRGKGETEPLNDNSTEEKRSKNRRVEFQLLRRWWSSVY